MSRLGVGVAAGQGRWSRDSGTEWTDRAARGVDDDLVAVLFWLADSSRLSGCWRPGGRAPPVGAGSGVRL